MHKVSKAERRSDTRVVPISVEEAKDSIELIGAASGDMCLAFGRVRSYSDIDDRSGDEMTPIVADIGKSSTEERDEVHAMFYGNMQSGMQTALVKERIQKETIVRMNREARLSVG